jgi:anti-sigma factor RsiW
MMISKFQKPLTCFRLAQHVGRQPPSSRPSILLLRSAAPSQHHRYLSSTMPQRDEDNLDHNGPQGELFHGEKTLGPSLTGKTASIRRVFGAGSNAAGLLTCGGEQLARHASFDPDYTRAQGWIRHHAVGPAVLSPVLISGLVGALVEAVFPNSVPVSCSISHLKPLIVSHSIEKVSVG